MDLEIGEIEVRLSGAGWDEKAVGREIERYLTEALERVAREAAPGAAGRVEIVALELPSLDWEAEADKTGKLVALIIAALEMEASGA